MGVRRFESLVAMRQQRPRRNQPNATRRDSVETATIARARPLVRFRLALGHALAGGELRRPAPCSMARLQICGVRPRAAAGAF
jgi:hypothetical protein